MAMITIEGGESRAAKKGWSGAPISWTTGRFGGLAWRPASNWFYQTSTARDTVVLGFAYYYPSAGSGVMVTFGNAAAATQLTVQLDGSGGYTLRRGSSTVIATSPLNALTASAWQYIEIKAKVHDTAGVFEIKINGTVINSFTGDTCQTGTDYTVTRFDWSSATNGTLVDDLYFLDTTGPAPYNDYMGDMKIETLVPNGNGNSSQLVGSDGNSVDNYALVDEIPASATDYAGSAVVGNKDTYALSNLVTSAGSVLAVLTSAFCFKSDAGAANIQVVERVGTTERESAAVALAASPGSWHDLGCNVLDPTGAAWTITNVNAMEVGVKVA